jgi:hypothetical protein
MVEIPRAADGSPVYRANYSLAEDGSWLITVETESGELAANAARLADVERCAYAAVRQQLAQNGSPFTVTFSHQIDLTQQSTLST